MRALGKRSASAVTVSISCCAGEHSALEFEVGESVASVRGLGESQHGIGGEGFLVAQTQPCDRLRRARCGKADRSSVGRRRKTDSRGLRRWSAAGLHREGPQPAVKETGRADRAAPTRSLSAHGPWCADRRSAGRGLRCRDPRNVSAPHSEWRCMRRAVVRRRAGCDSSSTRRIFSPPGTSPTPVCPALSVSKTTLRVKNGACAPLRLSSMLSCPATGIDSHAGD